jgi:hypothetical protein
LIGRCSTVTPSPFFALDIFKIESHELFAQASLEL